MIRIKNKPVPPVATLDNVQIGTLLRCTYNMSDHLRYGELYTVVRINENTLKVKGPGVDKWGGNFYPWKFELASK